MKVRGVYSTVFHRNGRNSGFVGGVSYVPTNEFDRLADALQTIRSAADEFASAHPDGTQARKEWAAIANVAKRALGE